MKSLKEEAIPLVTVEDGKFKVNSDAIAILSEITTSVVVLGVAGQYRTGKSFLLNRIILNREKGFGVAPTINACTKGIWMWSKPIRTQNEAGETVNTIVLDSEGLGAIDQDASHDCRIFALVLLLSSVFMYNSMGAIDESAIENLSLVINLTKHIRTRVRKFAEGDEDEDSEDFANYFPAFIWVLRDFALQLVDKANNPITSRQYLEQSLELQPGVSDEVEKSNRVRRLISSFFRDRDCYTLVRPLTDESDLQKLESLDFSSLRSEFVTQALELRHRALSLDRKKAVCGREVNGQALAGLLIHYTDAINNGAVPNIEGAWAGVCESQNRQLIESILSDFGRFIGELQNSLPQPEETLRHELKQRKKELMGLFAMKVLGEPQQAAKLAAQVGQKLRAQVEELLQDNDREYSALLDTQLEDYYAAKVAPKIPGMNSLTEARQTLEEAGDMVPKGPQRVERVLRFAWEKVFELATTIERGRDQKFEAAATLSRAEATELRAEARRAREEFAAQRRVDEEKLRVQVEAADALELQVKRLERSEASLREELASERKTLQTRTEAEVGAAKARAADAEAQLAELRKKLETEERRMASEKQALETELALTKQKLGYLETAEVDWTAERKRMSTALAAADENARRRLAEADAEATRALTALKEQVALLRAQKESAEEAAARRDDLNESMAKDFGEKELQLKSFLASRDEALTALKATAAGEFETQLADLRFRLDEQTRTVEELEIARKKDIASLATAQETEKRTRIELEKESALRAHAEEIGRVRQEELDLLAEELKKAREAGVLALAAAGDREGPSFAEKLEELRANFAKQLKTQLQDAAAEAEETRASLASQLASEEARGLGLAAELAKTREALAEASADSARLELRVQGLSEKLELSDKKLLECREELEQFKSERLRAMEAELERLAEAKTEEARAAREAHEASVKSLQALFASERRSAETRATEERERAASDFAAQIEELRGRHAAAMADLSEEVEELRFQLNRDRANASEALTAAEREAATQRGRAEADVRRAAEARADAERELADEKQRGKARLEAIESELTETRTKLAEARAELGAKTLEAFSETQAVEQLKNALARLEADRERETSDFAARVAELSAARDKLATERQTALDEAAAARAQLTKDLALATQRVGFLERRVEELVLAGEEREATLTANAARERAEADARLASAQKAAAEEIAGWENRFEEKKKAAKEAEVSLAARVAEAERARAALAERLVAAEAKKEELETRMRAEAESSAIEARRLREGHLTDRRNVVSDLEAHRREKYELEIALAEATARGEKDRAILEGKLAFLEQQNRKLRADLSDHQGNFEAMFAKFHQYRQADREESSGAHTATLAAMEARHAAQLAEAREASKAAIEAARERARTLEREVKRLEAAAAEAAAGRLGGSLAGERRVAELLESERKPTEELANARAREERLALKLAAEAEKEREVARKKLAELDARLKKAEADKQAAAFEAERGRTKWEIEREHLAAVKAESADALERVQRAKEELARENEKLRGDLKALKKAQGIAPIFARPKNENSGDRSAFLQNQSIALFGTPQSGGVRSEQNFLEKLKMHKPDF